VGCATRLTHQKGIHLRSPFLPPISLSFADVPIVGCVTRLTHQKGIHLIKHAAWRTMERGGQFVLLGSAPDPRIQAEFDALANQVGRRAGWGV